jgi:hypothetical protein
MAITMNRNLVTTADPLANDRIVSMRREVAMLDIDTTQFFTMLDRISTEEANSFKEEWLLDEYLPTNLSVAASVPTSGDPATAWTMATGEGDYLKVGDLLKVIQTGEVVRVTAASTSAATVVRAVGSVSAATAASGTTLGGLLLISGSAEQGQEMPTAIVTQLTTNYNYTQIVRNSYRYTGTAQWIDWYSGPQLARARMKVGVDHKRQIENVLWHGARSYAAGTTGPRHTAGGILEYLLTGTNNTTSVGGNLTKTSLQNFLRSGLRYGNRDRKVLFVAPMVAQQIGAIMDDDWIQAPPSTKVLGVSVDAIISAAWAGARVPVVVKGEWDRFGTGTANQLGSMGVLVDMENVHLKWAGDDAQGSRKISLRRERQAPSADEAAEEFLSEFTLCVLQPNTHALITGVTGYSVS